MKQNTFPDVFLKLRSNKTKQYFKDIDSTPKGLG